MAGMNGVSHGRTSVSAKDSDDRACIYIRILQRGVDESPDAALGQQELVLDQAFDRAAHRDPADSEKLAELVLRWYAGLVRARTRL
jgi:hypothetical protein